MTAAGNPSRKGGNRTFDHDLGGNPDFYSVDFQFKDLRPVGGFGVNQKQYGGDTFQVHPSIHSRGARSILVGFDKQADRSIP